MSIQSDNARDNAKNIKPELMLKSCSSSYSSDDICCPLKAFIVVRPFIVEFMCENMGERAKMLILIQIIRAFILCSQQAVGSRQ